MLDVQHRIEELSLQAQLTQEDVKMKADNADLFLKRLPDNAAEKLPNHIYHRIHLIDPTLVNKGQSYRPARKNTEAWKRMLDEHIAAGQMRASSSPYSSPAFVIPKHRDGVPDHTVDGCW